jgi:predicted GNAT family N-acyltransferase
MAADAKQDTITIAPVQNEAELMQALAIREVVFIEEQHVPEGIERDDDDARAYHLLALKNGHAVGTGRLVKLREPPPGEDGAWGKVGRMAVLKAERKSGLGGKILTTLEDEARRNQLAGLILHAQVSALKFYEKHGYRPIGAEFEEAGMPHLRMIKKLS